MLGSKFQLLPRAEVYYPDDNNKFFHEYTGQFGREHLKNQRSVLWTGSTRWRSWLRHCTTTGKVAGSILYGVI